MRAPTPGRHGGPCTWRRAVLLGSAGALVAGCSARRPSAPAVELDSLAAIAASVGGRVGVLALDTGSGRYLSHHENERFAMCSTFKWLLGAAVLARIDAREMSLDDRVRYDPSNLLEYAPITRAHVAEGSMTIESLARAAIVSSDNTAANLLLDRVDGPSGLTQFVRRLGDDVTRLDRNEPALNTNDLGDVRDTTTPRAMVRLMRALLCGGALSPAARARLIGWLVACETGRARLRAGLPANWTVGDKTGTGLRGATNDVAIAIPPGHPPILIASYLSDGPLALVRSRSSLDAAHARIGRLVALQLS